MGLLLATAIAALSGFAPIWDRAIGSVSGQASCCDWAWVTWLPGGTLRVSQTLPPMTDPRPMVTRPKMVAPA